MAFLSNDEVSEIKRKVNIVDLISQYVALSKTGRNYTGLCPFHGEKTPSFSVNGEKGFYHCFGCGKSGDAISFLQEYKNIGFADALRELAGLAGVALPDQSREPERENPNAPLYEINNQAARLYNTLLMSTELGEQAREYLAGRGIDAAIIKQFNIGLAPNESNFIYKNLSVKFDEKLLANSGLFHYSNNRVFDAFQSRIMFPITNEYGHTLGFSGRKWLADDESKAKYINTSATAIFDKSYELYNLDKAKAVIAKTREVYLMEGFMDVIAAHKAGIFNVVASMGTALTEKHVRRLNKLTKQYVLVYDGDEAGQHAIYKALDLIGSQAVQIVRVPERLDPDEYSKQYSLAALADLMTKSRMQPVEFLIDYLRPDNLSNLQAQLDFIEQMAPLIARVPSLTAQDAYVKKLVEILPDFEYNQVEQAVNSRRENVTNPVKFDRNAPEPSGNNFANQASEFDFADLAMPAYDESQIPQADYQYFSDGHQAAPQNRQAVATAPPKLSRSEHAEEQLLNRMIYHSSVLQRFSQDENFRFVHQSYQDLFDKLLLEAMMTDEDEEFEPNDFANQLQDEQKQLFYQILSLDLPEEVSDQELSDLTKVFAKEMEAVKFDELQNQLDVAKKAGNKERELELTLKIINQKKKLL